MDLTKWDAPEKQLMLAASKNRILLDAYCEVEERVGFTFKPDLALVQIRKRLEAGEVPVVTAADKSACWGM